MKKEDLDNLEQFMNMDGADQLEELGFEIDEYNGYTYWLLVIDNRHSAHLFINYIHGYIILEINLETIWRKDRLDTFEEFKIAFEQLRTFLTT